MEQIEKRNPVRTWIMASRPRTLTAAIVPVVVGTAVAVRDRVFNPWVALAALFSAVMIQIGTNLANDLFDFKKGADTHTRLGPTRVTSAGLLTPREVEIGMWVVFGLAAASGLYVIYVGGWPMLVIGVASILAGVAYTAGPFPLGYNGLGDLAVFIFFGLVAVLGTYYAQARAVTLGAVLAAVPVGALATAILVVNNVRDADTDRAAGKRTLAVLLGRGAARAEYAVLLTLAYAAPLALWLLRGASVWALLPLLTLPVAARLARVVITTEGPALNRALAGTAQLLALYGVLFALGIAL
ncbi:MAG: 1,4-dihydroxy-2-naphthoate octaprenyltransferase [Anaerolineales bacterium]|jgi:1,4-dihydroxy-2-naphthoate octaprenyltransferase|nr:1,4-dihydroxy-2-naphthoate octaprenyltransferase [Anaerolineales bacterium]